MIIRFLSLFRNRSDTDFLAAVSVQPLCAWWVSQLCPTLCELIDSSPPGPTVPGILQARTLEWVAISSSNARKWKVKVKSLSRVWLLATPWTAAHQAPPSMGFSRQEYWSGLPLPSPVSPTLLLPKWLSSLCVSFSYSAYHSQNCCRIYKIKTTILHCSL